MNLKMIKRKKRYKLGTEKQKGVQKNTFILTTWVFVPLFPRIFPLFCTYYLSDYQQVPIFPSFLSFFEKKNEKTPFYIQKGQYI